MEILVTHPLTKQPISADQDTAKGWGARSMEGYEADIEKYARMVTRSDTKVSQWFVNKYAGSLQNLYLGTITAMPIVNRIINAEKEGIDAVVLGCHGDNGVQMARSAVSIPVIGPCEASMAIGSFIGERFAMITIRKQYLRLLEHNIRLFGFEDRFINKNPVRWLDQWLWDDMIDAHRGKPEKLIDLFEKTALKCIEDGADTILVPGFPFGSALSVSGYTEVRGTGVPVVDGAAAAFKMAELLCDLKRYVGITRTTAQISQFQGVPQVFIDRVFQEFGI